MTATGYDVHGLTVVVDSADPRVVAAVHQRLRRFPRAGGTGGTGGALSPTLRIRIRTCVSTPPDDPARTGRPVYDTPEGPVRYVDATDRLGLSFGGRAGFAASPGRRHIALWAAGSDDEAVWLVSHPLLTLVLAEALKREERYPLHAAAMSPGNGDVVLFAGPSGAGKTTLALALQRAGWGYLAEDMVFLAPDPAAGAVTVLGFADEIDVTEETCALFPDLLPAPAAPAALAPAPRHRAKRPVLVEEAFADPPIGRGRAAALVLPSVGPGPGSELAPLAAGEALAALAPNVLLTEARTSQLHLDALGALVSTVPCWRLSTGTDFADLAARLAALTPR